MAYSSKYTETVLKNKNEKSNYIESVLNGTYETKYSYQNEIKKQKEEEERKRKQQKLQEKQRQEEAKKKQEAQANIDNLSNDSFFKNTNAFNGLESELKDGYQFGDFSKDYYKSSKAIAKTIVSTGADALTGITKGIMRIGEGIGDLAT